VTPCEALLLIPAAVLDLAQGPGRSLSALAPVISALATLLHAVQATAAGAIQAAAEGAAASGTMTAEAALARPEVVASRLRFLSVAYSMVWAILAVYLVMLSLRQRRLARQIRRLRDRIGA
jgi:CcmD family protein